MLGRIVVRSRVGRLVGGALAVLVLAAGLTAITAGGVGAHDGETDGAHDEELEEWARDWERRAGLWQERDRLIEAQGQLLNGYRCRFGVDMELVPGGCFDGQPVPGLSRVGNLFDTSTFTDYFNFYSRIQKISSQEALLNGYRCRFGVDTELVPGGCALNSEAAVDSESVIIEIPVYLCVPAVFEYSSAKLQAEVDLLNANVRDFFLQESSNKVSLNFVPGEIISPDISWYTMTIGDWWRSPGGWNPCIDAVNATSEEVVEIPLILAHVLPGNGAVAFAGPSQWAIVPTVEMIHYGGREYYYSVITHELGHLVFNLDHDTQYNSIMSIMRPNFVKLGDEVISCRHQFELRWPQHDDCNEASKQENGGYAAISLNTAQACGLGQNGLIDCWGHGYRRLEVPSGAFSSISTGQGFNCGLRLLGSVECWGDNYYGGLDAPDGVFNEIAIGELSACGLRVDGSVECWGDNYYGGLDAPSGSFAGISSGLRHVCGLHLDGTVECWGDDELGQLDGAGGEFASISAGAYFTCGLRVDGSVECWGNNYSRQLDAPDAKFATISAGFGHVCGLRLDGTVECWGDNGLGQLNAPPGSFEMIFAGGSLSCGLRSKGTVDCWGEFSG